MADKITTEDLHLVIRATCILCELLDQSTLEEDQVDASTLWETHVSVVLKTQYPQHQFCDGLYRRVMEEVLVYRRQKPFFQGNCSPGGSTGYSLSWLRQSTAFPCRAMVVATSGL